MRRQDRQRFNPVRFLVLVVSVEVVLAAAVMFDSVANAKPMEERSWRSWLALLAFVYLFVVVCAVVLVVRDQAAMRREIRSRDRALAARAETTNDWLWETTPDMVITYCSRHVRDLLGYESDELVGRDAHELMTPSTARSSREAIANGLASQGWHDVRSEWVHTDDHVVVLLHSGVPITDDNGTLIGYRGGGSLADDAATQEAAYLARVRVQVEAVIRESSLDIALQPIISVDTGRLVGVEALARFADGGRPDVWFDKAGKVGLRAELEMLAIDRALARLPELRSDVTMSINACPEVVIDPRFTAMLLSADLPLSRVIIEITEHVRIDEYGRLQDALDVLRAAGARVAVDDAGAGYASLSHVLRLRPDNIKIDRSIIANLDTDKARRTLITALVLLALDLDATVTAEGVETPAELEAVAALGVDHAQGYLIAKPSVDISTWPSVFLREKKDREPPAPVPTSYNAAEQT